MIAGAIQKRTMSADKFFESVNRPENRRRRFELVRGCLLELPRPNLIQKRISRNTRILLDVYARKSIKGAVNARGVILERNPDTVRVPFMGYYEDGEVCLAPLSHNWIELAPRLAVEVLGLNDRAQYLHSKIGDYLINGVELVWIIDPWSVKITILSTKCFKTLTEKDTITGGDVLPGFECKVADFFAMPATTKKPKRKR